MRLGRHYEFMLFKFRTKPIDIKKSTTDGNGRLSLSIVMSAWLWKILAKKSFFFYFEDLDTTEEINIYLNLAFWNGEIYSLSLHNNQSHVVILGCGASKCFQAICYGF